MAAETAVEAGERLAVKAIAERLRSAVEKAGGNKAVAERSGVPLRTLNGYLAAEADPKITKLGRIASVCGVSLDHLLGRKTHDGDAENGPIDGLILPGDVPDGFITIPRLDVQASAGPGRAIVPRDDDELLPRLAFQERWLRSLGVSPGNAEFLEAVGDSMKPTIQDGDLMLIDRGFGDVLDALIYVFVRDGFVSVKRVQRLALGGLQLISDNPAYPTQLVRADEMDSLSIEGRVVWYGRAM